MKADEFNHHHFLFIPFSRAVLHLGNVFFHRKALKHGQEGVEMGSDAEVRWVSHLLQLRTDGIVAALTTKTTVRCCFIDFLSMISPLPYDDTMSLFSIAGGP